MKIKDNSEYVVREEKLLNIQEEINNNAKTEEVKIFAKNFNKLLEEKEYTNKSFAEKGVISESSISNYRKGKTMPDSKMLEIIAKKLDVSVNHLLGIDECKKVTAQQIYNMLGLNEYAIEHLYSLKHDIEEVKEIETDAPVSNRFEKQLETLNLLIADKRNLIYILNTVGIYINKKQELLKLKEETDGKDVFERNKIESLARDIVHIKAEIQEYLYMSLDYIVDKLLRAEER